MKYTYILLLLAAVVLGSCFNTKFDDTEQKRLQRIRDSIRTDSINTVRSKPDTTLAIYKRTAFCDSVHVVVFDRVKMLSGNEAVKYAKMHKRFDNTDNIIVNQDILLETLKVAKNATILLLDDGEKESTEDVMLEIDDDNDTLRYIPQKPTDLAEGLPKEELVLLVLQYRSVVYLKQLPRME